jgi:hypothetical protein
MRIKVLLISIFLFLVSCATQEDSPDLNMSSSYAIYFESDNFYAKDELLAALDIVAETFEKKVSQRYPAGIIKDRLKFSKKVLTINFKVEALGKAGSCATMAEPLRACKGFKCSASANGWCRGLYEPSYFMITVLYDDCIGRTALAHELIHVYSHLVTGDYDPRHENPDYFGSDNSVESLAQNLLIQKFCSEKKSDDNEKANDEAKEKSGIEKNNDKEDKEDKEDKKDTKEQVEPVQKSEKMESDIIKEASEKTPAHSDRDEN